MDLDDHGAGWEVRCAIRGVWMNSPQRSQGSATPEGGGTAVVPQRVVRTRYAKSGSERPRQRA